MLLGLSEHGCVLPLLAGLVLLALFAPDGRSSRRVAALTALAGLTGAWSRRSP